MSQRPKTQDPRQGPDPARLPEHPHSPLHAAPQLRQSLGLQASSGGSRRAQLRVALRPFWDSERIATAVAFACTLQMAFDGFEGLGLANLNQTINEESQEEKQEPLCRAGRASRLKSLSRWIKHA